MRQDALIITVPLKRPESELKNPAMFASAEATDAEAVLGAQNWALWLLTAAMLHPASEELWKYSELLPHHIPTEAPLNIRLLDPPPAVQAAEPRSSALPGRCPDRTPAGSVYMAKPQQSAGNHPG